jgi:hypothetical protein
MADEPEVVDVEAAPTSVSEALSEFCSIQGRSGNNTIYHCLACKTLFKSQGDSKQWTLTCAPIRALAHIARAPNKGVRLCNGKYSSEQKAAIKQAWDASQQTQIRKKRKSEDGEATVVLDGRPPLPLDPSEARSGFASTSQRTLEGCFNIKTVSCVGWQDDPLGMHGGHLHGRAIAPPPAFLWLQKEDADLAVAMAFYANGIPFRVVRNRYFRTMLRKVGSQGPRYKPPSYNTLRTKLLTKVRDRSDCNKATCSRSS